MMLKMIGMGMTEASASQDSGGGSKVTEKNTPQNSQKRGEGRMSVLRRLMASQNLQKKLLLVKVSLPQLW